MDKPLECKYYYGKGWCKIEGVCNPENCKVNVKDDIQHRV